MSDVEMPKVPISNGQCQILKKSSNCQISCKHIVDHSSLDTRAWEMHKRTPCKRAMLTGGSDLLSGLGTCRHQLPETLTYMLHICAWMGQLAARLRYYNLILPFWLCLASFFFMLSPSSYSPHLTRVCVCVCVCVLARPVPGL
jgi:hypothetical protein